SDYSERFKSILCKIFDEVKGDYREVSEIHTNFIKNWVRPGDEIISFNYDLEIENALWNSDLIQWHWTTGYGEKWKYFYTWESIEYPFTLERWRKEIEGALRNESEVKVWKPHGSLNFI